VDRNAPKCPIELRRSIFCIDPCHRIFTPARIKFRSISRCGRPHSPAAGPARRRRDRRSPAT
jgi:hypothetical protein